MWHKNVVSNAAIAIMLDWLIICTKWIIEKSAYLDQIPENVPVGCGVVTALQVHYVQNRFYVCIIFRRVGAVLIVGCTCAVIRVNYPPSCWLWLCGWTSAIWACLPCSYITISLWCSRGTWLICICLTCTCIISANSSTCKMLYHLIFFFIIWSKYFIIECL